MVATIFLLGTAISVADATINLADWRQVGAPVWEFSDTGVTAGPSTSTGYLVSTSTYDNFHLSIEFWIDDDTNSGIFLRCGEITQLNDINPDRCYEVNIWDNHPNQDFRTGSIVTLAKPVTKVDTLGHWNRYDIIANGATVRVSLNGIETVSLENDRSASGLIALQYAGKHGLKFRQLVIEAEIKTDTATLTP
jgi:hypothetical protein